MKPIFISTGPVQPAYLALEKAILTPYGVPSQMTVRILLPIDFSETNPLSAYQFNLAHFDPLLNASDPLVFRLDKTDSF